MKKMTIYGDQYQINSRKAFNSPLSLQEVYVQKCFDFAYDMTFGTAGEHRSYRSGGQVRRKNGEIFINTFQGKLAEYCVYQYFTSFDVNIDEPDTRTFSLGMWDSYDFEVRGSKIAVKSTKYYGNLLLLETKDWNSKGEYLPNINSNDALYDYFVLVRISPDGESIMRKNRLMYNNSIEKDVLHNIIVGKSTWEFDLPGYINRAELVSVINNRYVIPQNALLNGNTKMDAEKYYIQAGDMHDMQQLISLLID